MFLLQIISITPIKFFPFGDFGISNFAKRNVQNYGIQTERLYYKKINFYECRSKESFAVDIDKDKIISHLRDLIKEKDLRYES